MPAARLDDQMTAGLDGASRSHSTRPPATRLRAQCVSDASPSPLWDSKSVLWALFRHRGARLV
eukprot:14611080-Alexandrium_andersonii.AAC.1